MKIVEIRVKDGLFISFKDFNSAENLMRKLLEEFKKESGKEFKYCFGEHIEKGTDHESKVKFVIITGEFDSFLFAEFYTRVSKQNTQFEKLEAGIYTLSIRCSKEDNNDSIILEQVFPVGTKKNDIKKAFEKEIDKIQCVEDVKVLVITDPFLFKDNNQHYINFLNEFLDSLIRKLPNLEKLVFITPDTHIEEYTYNNIEKYLKENFKNLQVKKINWKEKSEFHDRLYILFTDKTNCKTIVSGTSLNGIGKRISVLFTLNEEDNREIAKIISSNYPECFT